MKLKVDSLAAALQGIESDRKLSKEIVKDALVEALTKAYRKHIEIPDAYVKVEIKNGEIQIFHQRLVVDDVEDDELEISLADARKTNPNIQTGDMVDEEVDFSEFDRAAVVLAKNVMKQKIREAEKAQVYEEYCDKVDDLITGQVESVEEKFVLVRIDDKTLAMMKKSAQIPTETYREGQLINVVITEVNKDTKGAQVLVSRSTPVFVRRLFEKEVPEIYQGVIEIKAIAREPGERSKIAVISHNENIDPIGACIGPKGSRVQMIINALGGEKIDIFEWSDNIGQLIANALAPSEVIAVIPNENVKDGLIAVVPDNQLSLAIGKRGKNARLAVKLSNRKIDIKSKSEMEELGIDYMALAAQMQAEYEAKKAAERAWKQQEKINAFNEESSDIEGVEVADFTYQADTEPEEAFYPVVEEENLPAVSEEKKELPAQEEKPVEPEKPKELDEMEMAAKIAKEKRKENGLEVKEFTSKFEDFANTHARPEQTVSKKKRWDDKQEDKTEVKPKEKKKQDFNTMKPIYTDEELAEIEEKEMEEEESAWADDVDYEEYDSYYD
jgi:N utilization substance protein A